MKRWITAALFFDVYVGALYLPVKVRDAQQVIVSKLPKQITLHFLVGVLTWLACARGLKNSIACLRMSRKMINTALCFTSAFDWHGCCNL